ncbi:hypothetical protein FE782_11830 [Paenibacillus antri]|uniref:EamA domain-containing protein n=1 Tax=Paenibacillus antri TaxID=2582848 RepID=A0A5R9GH25_9BACL|nr:EamA family transporter [Paenibacillus antri]TLS52053.1 hypothetical protein FE782_11830 [Paenibacillus antri]
MKIVYLVLVSSLLSTVGNLLWKWQFSKHPLDLSSIASIAGTFMSWKVLLGGLGYFCSMVLFFYLLSNYKMSVIIPLQSITYLLNLAVAVALFKEKMSLGQAFGTAIIMIGIVVLLRANDTAAAAAG